MTNATTLPTVSARPASTGFCSCVTAPKAYVKTCSRNAKWFVGGRRYCEQHLPTTVTRATGEPGDRTSVTTYAVVKKPA